MQVTVFIDRLTRALSLVTRIVSTRNQLPILGNVLLNAEGGNLYLTTTNLETAITTKITAVTQKEGKITVPAKQLSELIALIKEEKVEICIDKNNLIIKGKKTKNSLNTTAASEFPPVVKKGDKSTIIVKEKEFTKAITQAAIATSQDENRPLLGGLRVVKKEKGLEMAATDGYRLTVKEIETEKADIDNVLIFPIKTLLEVVRISQEEKAKEIRIVTIKEQNQAIFLFEQTEVVTRLVDGEFPNFQKIIPSSFTTRTVIDREEFLNAVKISSIFARESANIVKLNIVEKTLTLSANAPSVGENANTLEVETEGENIEVAFNYRFLLDFLMTIDSERVVFETNGALNPGVFKTEKDNSFLHIIMPVRVQN